MASQYTESKDDFSTKPQKGVPLYPNTTPNANNQPHYGVPLSTRYISNVNFYGIILQDVALLPKVKGCAILSFVNSAVMFLISMLLYSVWMVSYPTWFLFLAGLILIFGYFSFYFKTGILFAFYLSTCLIIAVSSLFACISLVASNNSYDSTNPPEGWTEDDVDKRIKTVWAAFSFLLILFPVSLYQLWYSYQSYKALSESTIASIYPPDNIWQGRMDYNIDSAYGPNSQNFTGVVIGRTTG